MATSFLQYLESLKTSLESLVSPAAKEYQAAAWFYIYYPPLQGQNTELYLTSGNQSCDLDSIVSALAYAYYIARKVTPSTSEAIPISLPLLQCRREDLVLNQEVTKLFDMLGIDGSGILFLDDVTPAILSAVGKLSLTLVDHNVPTGKFIMVETCHLGVLYIGIVGEWTATRALLTVVLYTTGNFL